jgi:hypothetical protein
LKLSVTINVLDSHELIRRQIFHLAPILRELPHTELLIADDGSDLPHRETLKDLLRFLPHSHPSSYIHEDSSLRVILLETNDKRPWTQPSARNRLAEIASGSTLLMTDADHVLTEEAIRFVYEGVEHLTKFTRRFMYLAEDGRMDTSAETLRLCGLSDEEICKGRYPHPNTFAVSSGRFELMGGYDEGYSGKYGHDDTDFLRRYKGMFGGEITIGPSVGVIYGGCAALGLKQHGLSRKEWNERKG